MQVTWWVWAITLATLAVLLACDMYLVARRPREPSMREAATWVAFYLTVAVLFGLAISAGYGVRYGGEFLAGWLTEYSLSADNLFVFVIIMARFRTPAKLQQKALMIGIVLALIMRGGFIVLGSAALARFEWIFYIFGGFLVYTAVNLVRNGAGEESGTQRKDNVLIRWFRRVLPITEDFDGGRLRVERGGRRLFTPLVIVVVALGTTDLIFALDSIPAIFGLTKEAYLVLTANVFALMGLRQLYFLLGGLLDRLVYLSLGLAAVLGFIGVKLVLEALHENNLPFLNGGRPIEWAPPIPIWLSLVVIVGILGVAVVASLVKSSSTSAELSRVKTRDA